MKRIHQFRGDKMNIEDINAWMSYRLTITDDEEEEEEEDDWEEWDEEDEEE